MPLLRLPDCGETEIAVTRTRGRTAKSRWFTQPARWMHATQSTTALTRLERRRHNSEDRSAPQQKLNGTCSTAVGSGSHALRKMPARHDTRGVTATPAHHPTKPPTQSPFNSVGSMRIRVASQKTHLYGSQAVNTTTKNRI